MRALTLGLLTGAAIITLGIPSVFGTSGMVNTKVFMSESEAIKGAQMLADEVKKRGHNLVELNAKLNCLDPMDAMVSTPMLSIVTTWVDKDNRYSKGYMGTVNYNISCELSGGGM